MSMNIDDLSGGEKEMTYDHTDTRARATSQEFFFVDIFSVVDSRVKPFYC